MAEPAVAEVRVMGDIGPVRRRYEVLPVPAEYEPVEAVPSERTGGDTPRRAPAEPARRSTTR